jgi:hypothetical protein
VWLFVAPGVVAPYQGATGQINDPQEQERNIVA